MTAAPASRDEPAARRALPTIERETLLRAAVAVGLLLVALLVLPAVSGADWITTYTSVAIYSVVALGFGVLYGRVGMISLGQVALLTVGCWVGTRISYASSIPFPLMLLAAGGITMVVGVIVGLPALRLSGLYLALITLMFAGAVTVIINKWQFPNGGHGFIGHLSALDVQSIQGVRRPGSAHSDTSYFRYVVICC